MLKINYLTKRHILFQKSLPEWDLTLHLIIGKKRNYLIDTGLGSQDAETVLAFLESTDNHHPLIIINTHAHFDHHWGNHVFSQYPIIAHQYCYDLLEKNWESDYLENNHYRAGAVEKTLPNILFEDSIEFPEDGLTLLYTPGHTIDGISVWDSVEKVLNAGDNIGDTMEHIVPDIEDSASHYLQTLQLYEQLQPVAIVSGHNKVLDASVIESIKKSM